MTRDVRHYGASPIVEANVVAAEMERVGDGTQVDTRRVVTFLRIRQRIMSRKLFPDFKFVNSRER